MRPIWLIESDAFGAGADSLKVEIRRQGMKFGLIDHDTFRSGYVRSVDSIELEEKLCVIFVGTWPMWRHIQLHWPGWIPAGWCDTKKLDCAAYYPHFAPFLLNDACSMMSGIEAIEKRNDLFDKYESNGQVFARPTGCLKVFNGRCLDKASFVSALAPARYDPGTQVLIAKPKDIQAEWRFIIACHEPIAVSQYLRNGKRNLDPEAPKEVWGFVKGVLAQVPWEPDEVFVMDICESSGRHWVLELNGFSCAGLYACDRSVIVERASNIAMRAWYAHQSLSEVSS